MCQALYPPPAVSNTQSNCHHEENRAWPEALWDRGHSANSRAPGEKLIVGGRSRSGTGRTAQRRGADDTFAGMSEHLKAHVPGASYFCTLTVVGWADVFTRRRCAEVVLESLAFCQANKGLELFAYCLMPVRYVSDHLHMIARVQEGRLSDVLRDLKSYTAKRILDLVITEPGESRREWMIRLFQEAAEGTNQNQAYMFWQKRSLVQGCSTRRWNTFITTR